MKHSFTKAQDALQAWADSGFNGDFRSPNVFTRGNKAYSYGEHYILAEYIVCNDGQKYLFVNTTGWSVTTSKHIAYAHRLSDYCHTIDYQTRDCAQSVDFAAQRERNKGLMNVLASKYARARKDSIKERYNRESAGLSLDNMSLSELLLKGVSHE